MRRHTSQVLTAALTLVLALAAGSAAAAESKSKIVCWKDKAGKVGRDDAKQRPAQL